MERAAGLDGAPMTNVYEALIDSELDVARARLHLLRSRPTPSANDP